MQAGSTRLKREATRVAIVRYLACVAFDTVFTKKLCNRAPPIRALVFCDYLSEATETGDSTKDHSLGAVNSVHVCPKLKEFENVVALPT